jgi:hypothetical protein
MRSRLSLILGSMLLRAGCVGDAGETPWSSPTGPTIERPGEESDTDADSDADTDTATTGG